MDPVIHVKNDLQVKDPKISDFDLDSNNVDIAEKKNEKKYRVDS
jgi:hypothetical protein